MRYLQPIRPGLVQYRVTMAHEEDNRIKSTKTWIKWNNLEDGTSMKYGEKLFTKPEQCEQLIIELKRRMKNNDAAKRKRNEHIPPKKSRVKYDDAIGKVNMNNTWIKWTELKPGEKIKYGGREFHKDVPDDQEKLMTRIINRMQVHDKVKDQKNNIKAADALMVMMSDIKGEQKEGADINDVRRKGMGDEFDIIDSLHNHDYDNTDIDGTIAGTDNGMMAGEYVCYDDRKNESNEEIEYYTDNYNTDDGGGGGSVVNNNTANLEEIAYTLMNLNRGIEEKQKCRAETGDEIDDDGDLKPAAKPTEFILRHDTNSVNNNDEGGKGEDKEFDTFFNRDDDNTNIERSGGNGAASINDKTMAEDHRNIKKIDNNDGYNSVDEKGRNSFADNNDGNNSTITKMGNNNSSNSAGSTKQKEELSPGKLKLWYDNLSVVQQRKIEMNVNAVLNSGCMAETQQLFDTTVHQLDSDNDDNDNVIGEWDLDEDLDVGGGGFAENNNQKIAAKIRGEEDLDVGGGGLPKTIIKR